MNQFPTVTDIKADEFTPSVNENHSSVAVRTQFSAAIHVQKKRKLSDVVENIKHEAKWNGRKFFYGWGAGKNNVEGASIQLALTIARLYQNSVVDVVFEDLDENNWKFTATFVDLENGFTLNRHFIMSKNYQIYGRMDEHRKKDMRIQIGQSKAMRNVILNSTPQFLADIAIEEAKKSELGVLQKRIEDTANEKFDGDFIKATRQVKTDLVSAFKKLNVSESSLCSKLRSVTKEWTQADMILLISDLSAIQNGEVSAKELYGVDEKKQKSKTQEMIDKKKQDLAQKHSNQDPEKQKDLLSEEGDNQLDLLIEKISNFETIFRGSGNIAGYNKIIEDEYKGSAVDFFKEAYGANKDNIEFFVSISNAILEKLGKFKSGDKK